MNKTLFAVLAVIIAWIAAPCPAHAIRSQFCFYYEVDYDDALGGDYWTNDDDRPARGMWVEIRRNSDGQVVFVGHTDPETGCTGTYKLSSSQEYTIDAYLRARIGTSNSNFVRVRPDEGDETNEYWVRLASHFVPSPNHPDPYHFTYPDGVDHGNNAVYLAAAAGFALHRQRAGVGGENLYMINHQCQGGACCHDNGRIFISPGSRDNKFTICHEIGHFVGWVRNGFADWQHNYILYWDPVCSGPVDAPRHDLFSMETNGAGVTEGWADFYAAAVWNDSSEDNCSFWTSRYLDYNRDGQVEPYYGYSC
jgi:hypothetical protein